MTTNFGEDVPAWLPKEKVIVLTVGGSMSGDGKRLAQIVLDYKTARGKQLAFFGKPGDSRVVPLKSYPLVLGERITEVLSYRTEKSGPLGVGVTFTTSAGRTFTLNEAGIKKLGPQKLSTKRSKGWMMTGLRKTKEGGLEGAFMQDNQAPKALLNHFKELEPTLGDLKSRKFVEAQPKSGPTSKVGLVNFGDRRRSALHSVRGTFNPWFNRKLDGTVIDDEALGPHGDARFEELSKSPKPLRKGSSGSSSGVYKSVAPKRQSRSGSDGRPMSPQPHQSTDGQEQAPEGKTERRQWFGKANKLSSRRR